MKVVTGVIGNDIHVVANRLMELSLDARGYLVVEISEALSNGGQQTRQAKVFAESGFSHCCNTEKWGSGVNLLNSYQ